MYGYLIPRIDDKLCLQVPVYQGDDGFCLFESNAIAHYCKSHAFTVVWYKCLIMLHTD